MEEVIEIPEVIEGQEEVEITETPESGEETPEGEQPESPEGKDDPYTTRFSREFRAATKAWETANPEAAKYAKQARDNHARLFALQQVEPKGIDGVRERYALLDAIGGADGLTGLQEQLAGIEEVDNLLISGNPKAFDALGEDFNEGLAKLAPAYLDRVKLVDPAAFEAAVMPHVVSTLAGSDLLKHFNSLVDIFNTTNDPRLGDKEKLAYAYDALGKMAAQFNSLSEKGQVKPADAPKKDDEFQQERTKFEQEKQDHHWNTNIKPQAVQHENSKFEELFNPYQKRLRLDTGAKSDLLQAFKSGLNGAGKSDAEYQRQMKLYRGQKNPDPAAVANYVKNAINKHSKSVMEGLIKARYGSFLSGKPKTQPTVKPGAKPGTSAAPNVEIRTVKPAMEEIDHRNTPVDWLAQRQYKLYSGKVVKVVKQ